MDYPKLIKTPFANSGLKNEIPETVNDDNGFASMEAGFPQETMVKIADGGVPPRGQDFNGILWQITQCLQYLQAGGLFKYNGEFASSSNVNGYPLGALVLSADGTIYWKNEVDGNQTDPDNGGTGWVDFLGDLKKYLPLTGGTVTGNIFAVGNDVNFRKTAANVDLSTISESQREDWALYETRNPADTTNRAGNLIRLGATQPANSQNLYVTIGTASPRGGNLPTGTDAQTSNNWSSVGVYYDYATNKGYPAGQGLTSWGKTDSDANHLASTAFVKSVLADYLPLAGGKSMTGAFTQKNVVLDDGVNAQTVMTAYDDGDNANYGAELVIGANGNTYIGGGESAGAVRTAGVSTATAENMHVSADGTVYIISNCNTIANRKTAYLGTDGFLHLPGEIRLDGSSGYIRRNVETDALELCGGTAYNTSPSISLYGSSRSSDAGQFTIRSGQNAYSLVGTAAGALSWGGTLSIAGNSYLHGVIKTDNYPQIVDTRVTRGTTPSTNYFRGLEFVDKSSNNLSKIEAAYYNSGNRALSIFMTNNSGTSTAVFRVHVDSSNNLWTETLTPAQTDSSTKIATTAYVKACVPKSTGSATNPVYTNANGVITATGGTWIKQSAASLAASGYCQLSNGLFLQWGNGTSSGAAVADTITFPKAFSSACYQVFVCGRVNSTQTTNGVDNWYAYPTSKTAAVIVHDYVSNSQNKNYSWFAIGK